MILLIDQILSMERVVQHSGTMVMVKEKIKPMLIGILLKILMVEPQTLIKLFLKVLE